jgi:heme oxygenase
MTAFSTLVRTATHEQHTETKASTFMSDLLGGRLGVDAYAGPGPARSHLLKETHPTAG